MAGYPIDANKITTDKLGRRSHFYDYMGQLHKVEYVSGKTLFVERAIVLIQQGHSYTLYYGLQVQMNLTYPEAAAELGACLLHQISSNKNDDNA